MQITSPFKFLDSYSKEDKDVFFGREEEVELLYELVFQSNLTLIYGESGTGKTSLVQCGLANRFNATHWFDIHIRRNDDINKSLLQELQKYEVTPSEEGGTLRQRLMRKRKNVQRVAAAESGHENEIIRRLRSLHKHYLKPTYLIFDQFEELFILGSEEEQSTFYDNIASILETENYCRVIIIMREESIAQLYHFEKKVPLLFEKRLRVEPLSRAKTGEVIKNTVEQYEIKLENDQLSEKIVDLLAEGQGRVELTHLQVFLDRLYQEAASNTNNGIVFTKEQIDRVGSIEDILGDFLGRQTNLLQTELEKEFPGITSSAVQKVLNRFVTLEGTKRPGSKESVQVSSLNNRQIGFIIDQLERNRLLRFDNDVFELSHDILAKHIAEQRSAAEVALLQIRKIVRDRQQAYEATKTLLNNNEVHLIQSFRKPLEEEKYLSSEEWSFVEKSIHANRRRRFLFIGTVITIVAALSSLALYSYRQSQVAMENAALADQRLSEIKLAQEQQKTANYEKYLNEGKALMANSQYEKAIQAFETAMDFDANGLEVKDSLASAKTKINVSSRFEQLIKEGDALFNKGEDAMYIDALSKYKAAVKLDFNNSLAESKIDATQGKLAVAFEKFKGDGDAFFNTGTDFGYKMAQKSYRQAARIKPADQYVRQRLRVLSEKLN